MAVDLLYCGVTDYQSMITHRYKLDEWELAFHNLRAKDDLKAFIHPNGTDWGD
jgi:threonine dehydrogenase-like Zn-dependent dehydrogenase